MPITDVTVTLGVPAAGCGPIRNASIPLIIAFFNAKKSYMASCVTELIGIFNGGGSRSSIQEQLLAKNNECSHNLSLNLDLFEKLATALANFGVSVRCFDWQ